jgi:hypothetical protein
MDTVAAWFSAAGRSWISPPSSHIAIATHAGGAELLIPASGVCFSAALGDKSSAGHRNAAVSAEPTGRQVLWIDIAGDLSPGEAETLAGRFKFDHRTLRALHVAGDRPHIALSGGHFHLRVAAEPDNTQAVETTWLDVIAGRNVVISQHRGPIRFLDDLDDRIEVDTTFGSLDSASFVASILDSTVTSYFNAADAIEDDVDRFDARALSDDGRRELLVDLVAVRRRIARLRRVLTDHRQVFAFLAGADLAQVAGSPDSALGFQSVAARFAMSRPARPSDAEWTSHPSADSAATKIRPVMSGCSPHVCPMQHRPRTDPVALSNRELPQPHAPVVVGSGAPDASSRADRMEARSVVSKPFDLDVLTQV